nr:MAG TPA: hypothetical protein [Caudoviricetes sp.]
MTTTIILYITTTTTATPCSSRKKIYCMHASYTSTAPPRIHAYYII